MIRLPRSIAAWGGDGFAETLKGELAALGPEVLPLHALSSTGHALDTGLSLRLLACRDLGDAIEATLEVQFEEIVPGCSCGYEAEPQPAYGRLLLTIRKGTGDARIEIAGA